MKKENSSKNKITSKQVVAMSGIVLLLLLYVVTFIVAITDNSSSGKLFWICLICTIVVPLLIWIYTWAYGKITGKHTITDAPSSNLFDEEQ